MAKKQKNARGLTCRVRIVRTRRKHDGAKLTLAIELDSKATLQVAAQMLKQAR